MPNAERVRRSQRARVEAAIGADLSRARAAVTEVQRRDIVRMAGDGEHRALHGSAAIANLDDRTVNLPALAAREVGARASADACHRCRADEHRVVPREMRERLRQLLQPAVVVEAAVEDRRIGPERDLDTAGGGGGVAPNAAIGPAGVIVRVGRAVFAITPSWTVRRQKPRTQRRVR